MEGRTKSWGCGPTEQPAGYGRPTGSSKSRKMGRGDVHRPSRRAGATGAEFVISAASRSGLAPSEIPAVPCRWTGPVPVLCAASELSAGTACPTVTALIGTRSGGHARVEAIRFMGGTDCMPCHPYWTLPTTEWGAVPELARWKRIRQHSCNGLPGHQRRCGAERQQEWQICLHRP